MSDVDLRGILQGDDKDVLQREISVIEELSEVEPGCKCIYSLAKLSSKQLANRNHQ